MSGSEQRLSPALAASTSRGGGVAPPRGGFRLAGALALSLLSLLLLLLCAGTAGAQTRVKVATVAPKGTPWSALLDKIKKRVLTRSNRQLKLKVYYGGRLGGENETVRETREGRVHMWGGSTAALAEAVPELYALEVPFLFSSNEEADFVIDRYARPHVEKLLRAQGFVLFQFAENGWHGIGLRDRCITGPESFQGVKIRSQEAGVYLDTFRALGANPVAMSVPEVLPALKQGTVDGFSTTPLFAFATSWYQGVKYFTPTHHVYQPAAVVYSKKWFDRLPKQQQDVLLANASEDEKEGRRSVRAIRQGLLDNFGKANIKVCNISEAQRDRLRQATSQLFASYRAKSSPAGQALYDAIAEGKRAFAAAQK